MLLMDNTQLLRMFEMMVMAMFQSARIQSCGLWDRTAELDTNLKDFAGRPDTLGFTRSVADSPNSCCRVLLTSPNASGCPVKSFRFDSFHGKPSPCEKEYK